MNSKNLIPDPALELTIRRITENLAVEEIYAYPFRTQGKLFNQLYVLLRHESGQEIISARALCNVAVSEKAGYHAYVLFPEDANRQLNQGNIRAALIFHPDNRVYENPSPGTRVVFQEVNYQKRYKKATQYFEKEIAKLHAFEQGYRLYMDSENYSQASFMLHQVLELGFRLAENLIMGKAKMTHSIQKHQAYIRSFSPEMGSLFAEDAWNILRKLDESYSAARYDHDFSVSKEDLLWAANKAKELLVYLMAFNQDLLDEIQRRQVASERINHESANGNLVIEEGRDTEGLEFFHFLANGSDRWWGEEGFPAQSETPKAMVLEKRTRAWKSYFWNAQGLMEMAADHIGTGYDESAAVVLGQAMEQLCLGLLCAFWGYRPDNIFNLMYLIRLTESISPAFRNHFCLDIPREREMVVKIAHALNEFRVNSGFRVDGYALHIVYDRLKRFSSEIEVLVDRHFEMLKSVS